MKNPNLAIIGATGLVGIEVLEILEQRNFPIKNLQLFASSFSADKSVYFKEKPFKVLPLKNADFSEIDIAIFSAGTNISQEVAPIAAKQGTFVIDNSSYFRMKKDVPLIVPEVNGSLLKSTKSKIIANPNCTTAPIVLPLSAIHKKYGLKKVIVSSYQSVSGMGKEALAELSSQIMALFNGKPITQNVFEEQIAFNCIPKIGAFDKYGYCEEEKKIINETKKILDLSDLSICATTVRIPTFSCHGEVVNVELKNTFELNDIIELLNDMPGIKLNKPTDYSTNISTTKTDDVYIGRIRKDLSSNNSLVFWCISDNLRKGAALNAVQIAEELVKYERF